MRTAPTTNNAVKSWFGFFFALAITAVNFYFWLTEEEPRYMLAGIGCLFWVYPWSQRTVPLSKFFAPGSASTQPLAKTLTTMGWGVLITSVIFPWLP